VGVETRLVFASSLSIFRGPLCETRQVIHGPDLHFSGKRRVYRGSLQPGDIHMGILTDDMKRSVREQRLYIATVCPDGTPNLSPKGTTAVWDDDHLVFADNIRSPQSVENIDHNPSAEVNVVDPLVRKGYRFKGRAVVHRSDEVFQRGCQMYRDEGLTIEIRAVVLIRVERALPLISWRQSCKNLNNQQDSELCSGPESEQSWLALKPRFIAASGIHTRSLSFRSRSRSAAYFRLR